MDNDNGRTLRAFLYLGHRVENKCIKILKLFKIQLLSAWLFNVNTEKRCIYIFAVWAEHKGCMRINDMRKNKFVNLSFHERNLGKSLKLTEDSSSMITVNNPMAAIQDLERRHPYNERPKFGLLTVIIEEESSVS